MIRDALLTTNGLFIGGIVIAALASALAADEFKLRRPNVGHVLRGLFGGALLGWGSAIGLGCTIGTLLSGVSAGAVSGWVFGPAIMLSATIVLKLGHRAGLLV